MAPQVPYRYYTEERLEGLLPTENPLVNFLQHANLGFMQQANLGDVQQANLGVVQQANLGFVQQANLGVVQETEWEPFVYVIDDDSFTLSKKDNIILCSLTFMVMVMDSQDFFDLVSLLKNVFSSCIGTFFRSYRV